MKFRTDINGLRAIAVMAVVLFHFNSSWVSGGFAGVDVFFVISGFLMTGLIFRGLENNNFSIINFYVARANRIIPALSVVLIVCLFLGYFLLSPIEYMTLAKHALSSMTFVSNFVYWKEAGYFAASSYSKWLLHTWSLSVEWQFYMIYPVVLVLLKKCMSLTNIKRLLVVGTVIGFIFSAYATYRWTTPAYFLFPTRAWEMMMGGLAFVYPLQNLKETSKKYLEWTGIALILASYVFISKDNLWPGFLALIPVLGAYLVIIANRSGSVITDNIVMQKVGLWSYSIYLWHWPVVVVFHKFNLISNIYILLGISLSLIISFFSYKFIEKNKFKYITASICTLFYIGFIFFSDGANYRVPSNFRYSKHELAEFNYGGKGYEPDKEYVIGNKNNIKYIFFGDSFGQQYSTGLANANVGFISYFDHGCFVSKNITRYFNGIEDDQCSRAFDKVKLISNQYPNANVIIASSWLYKNDSGFKGDKPFDKNMSESDWNKLLSKELNDIITELGVSRKYYIIARPQGDVLNSQDCLAKQGMSFSSECPNTVIFKQQDVNVSLKEYAATKKNVIYVDVNDYLCGSNKKCLINNGRYPIFSDGSHISVFGSKYVSIYLEERITSKANEA